MASKRRTSKKQLMASVKKEARKKLAPQFSKSVLLEFEIVKAKIISEFLNDPISLEIAAGPTAKSQFLSEGNLFSFLGLTVGSGPIRILREFLEERIRIIVPQTLSPNLSLASVCKFPSKDDFDAYSDFIIEDWGGSWPVRVEDGIPGLVYYNPLKNVGRSSGGVQMPDPRRKKIGQDWGGMPYITKYYKRYQTEFGRIYVT